MYLVVGWQCGGSASYGPRNRMLELGIQHWGSHSSSIHISACVRHKPIVVVKIRDLCVGAAIAFITNATHIDLAFRVFGNRICATAIDIFNLRTCKCA